MNEVDIIFRTRCGASENPLSRSKTDLLVANFPLSSRYTSQGIIKHPDGSCSFQTNNVVRHPTMAPPEAEHIRLRAQLRTEWRNAMLAKAALERLVSSRGADGWSLEHCQAASGEVDMLRWQPRSAVEVEPMDLLEQLRDQDLVRTFCRWPPSSPLSLPAGLWVGGWVMDMVLALLLRQELLEAHGPRIREKLVAELMQRVPPPTDAEARPAKGLQAEVEPFVSDFVELCRARLVQTPLAPGGVTPLEVLGEAPVSEVAFHEVYVRDGTRTADLMAVMLRQVGCAPKWPLHKSPTIYKETHAADVFLNGFFYTALLQQSVTDFLHSMPCRRSVTATAAAMSSRTCQAGQRGPHWWRCCWGCCWAHG